MSNLQNIGLQFVAMNRQARANRAQQELEERRLALAEQDNELARMRFSESKRQYDNSYNENRRQFNEQTRQFNASNNLAKMQQKIDQQNADANTARTSSYADQIRATVANMDQARQFEADDRTQKRNGNLWRSTAGKLYDYTDPDNPVMRNADDWYESGDLARLVPLFRQAGVLRNTELDGYDIIPNSIQRSDDGTFSVTGIDKNGDGKQFTVTADQINNAASLASLRRESNVHVFGQASDPTKQQYLTRDGLAQIARETGMGAEEQRQQSVSEPWVDDRVPQTSPPQTAAPKPNIAPTTPSATPFLPGMTEEQAALAAETSAKDQALHNSQAIERAKNATGRMKVSASKRLKELGKGSLSIADPVVQEKVNTPPTPQAVEKANATVEKAKSKKITAQEAFNTITAKLGSREWDLSQASMFAKYKTLTPDAVVVNGKRVSVKDIAKGFNEAKKKQADLDNKEAETQKTVSGNLANTLKGVVSALYPRASKEELARHINKESESFYNFAMAHKQITGKPVTDEMIGQLVEARNLTTKLTEDTRSWFDGWMVDDIYTKNWLIGVAMMKSNMGDAYAQENQQVFERASHIAKAKRTSMDAVLASYIKLKLQAENNGDPVGKVLTLDNFLDMYESQ